MFSWFIISFYLYQSLGFPGGSEVKASACNVGDPGLIPGSGRSPGEGNGNPLQCSCLENPMDRGAWWATLVHVVAKSWTWLSNFTFTLYQSLMPVKLLKVRSGQPRWLFSCSLYIPCRTSACFTYTIFTWLTFLHTCLRPQLLLSKR